MDPNPPSNSHVLTLPPWLQTLLYRRGFFDDDAIGRYLEPSLAGLDDPSTMADMDVAVQRLCRSVIQQERVVIYGDYDVDGVCSTAILVDFFRQLGVNADYYIPDRKSEGYGLNEAAVRQLATRADVLISADCGIGSHHEIAVARQLGCDVIVVDHHQVPQTLPPAIAALNPHRADCEFPFKGMCAAGVAFMMTVAIRRALRDAGYFAQHSEPDIRTLLDLTALATVADMVPLCATNRILVAAGLKVLSRTKRAGLAALMNVAQIKCDDVTASDIGFRLAPRINARGRLSHAGQAVELMLTHDTDAARSMAQALDDANRERQRIEKETVEAAIARVTHDNMHNDAALVLYDPTWHPGVLGLVASRLVARFHRPTFAIGEGGKGSGRSVAGFDLHHALQQCAGLLARFGGHKAAAGLTITESNVPEFRAAFCHSVTEVLGKPPFVPHVLPDLEIDPHQLNLALVDHMRRLEPFGQGNPEPLFVMRDVEVRDKRVVGTSHLKLTLGCANAAYIHADAPSSSPSETAQTQYSAIAFGLGDLADQLPSRVDVAFHAERNVFRGHETLQLRVIDIRSSTHDTTTSNLFGSV